MKIKRYFAPDIKQAIRMVREEQGPDAVILSNRKVDGGVEIVAAQDFDEQSIVGAASQATETRRSEPVSRRHEPEPDSHDRADSLRRAEEVFRTAVGARLGIPNADVRTPLRPSIERPVQASRERVSAPAAATPMPKNVPPRNNGESVPAQALQALQKEMRQMRQVLDSHFAEVSWENASRNSPTRIDLLRLLSSYGFSKKLSLQMANRLGGVEDFKLAWQGCQDLLASQLPVAEDNLLDYGGVVALVGPTGVGKTTTIAKLAARFRLKHGPRQIALITTDNYRIGAHDQLHTYGRILDVPVRTAGNADDLRALLSGFCDKRLVLIDTAGMGPRDVRLAEQFNVLRQDDVPVKSYLVLSATSQTKVMEESIRAFAPCAPKACILTKLDETGCLGGALSTLIENQLPVSLITDGQQVPEDLHMARTHLLLDQCFSKLEGDLETDVSGERPYVYEDWLAHAHV